MTVLPRRATISIGAASTPMHKGTLRTALTNSSYPDQCCLQLTFNLLVTSLLGHQPQLGRKHWLLLAASVLLRPERREFPIRECLGGQKGGRVFSARLVSVNNKEDLRDV